LNFRLSGGLPFIDLTITLGNKTLLVKNVLIDTGSAGTCFNADDVAEIGIKLTPECKLKNLTGIGGTEWVFETKVNKINIENIAINDFKIEVGELDYGFGISGILGCDFMRKVKLKLDFEKLILSS
jgi:predicted aspartyl protease